MPRIDRFDGEYRWLSNFWPAVVQFRLDPEYGPVITCRTVEHAYQALKTNNTEQRLAIASAETPGEAKRMGRYVSLRPDWEQVKIDVMRKLLRQKFSNSRDLRAKLVATGEAELIEGNTWGDTFWGVCRGKGQNHLGRLLMELRAELRDG